MSRNAKRSATSNSSPNHHESAQVLSPVDSADTSAEQRKKSTSRRRIELGVGTVILAGVLYLPFSPLLSMADPSQANTPAADATVRSLPRPITSPLSRMYPRVLPTTMVCAGPCARR